MKYLVMDRKKFAAVFLIALLLCIQFTKLLHSHEWNNPNPSLISNISTDSVVEKHTSFSCTICDYNLTNDVCFKKYIGEIHSPLYFQTFSSAVEPFISTSYKLTRSDRGPPAFLI